MQVFIRISLTEYSVNFHHSGFQKNRENRLAYFSKYAHTNDIISFMGAVMEYTFLGKSGLEISRICFGTMTFGGSHGFENLGQATQEEATRQIDICFEMGVNIFDTADMYSRGLSEEILGKAIGPSRREKAIIATKTFFRMGEERHDIGSSRKHILKACEDSLRRLKTDYIDLYQLHNFDALTPLEETLSALHTLVQQGKVRYIGCSNFSGWQIMKALNISERKGYEPFVSQQVYYSLIGRELEFDLIPLSLDQNLGILVWSPLAFGLLSGKYRRNQPKPENTRLAFWEAPGSIDWEKLYAIIDILDDIAKAKGKTVPQVALNWLLRRPGISSIIIGARNEKQLRDNLGAVGWSLSEEETRRLEAASEQTEIYPYWHQHKYAGDRNPFIQRAYCP